MRRSLVTAAVLALTTGAATARAAAQVVPDAVKTRPFTVIAHRDLTFGEVLPGIAETILSSDPGHHGLFEIQGTPGSPVRVEFVLPFALRSPAGAELPMGFDQGDGQADFNKARFKGTYFDPRAPLVSELGPNGKLWVRLGGTVYPTRDQAGGAYAATISITVFDLGI